VIGAVSKYDMFSSYFRKLQTGYTTPPCP